MQLEIVIIAYIICSFRNPKVMGILRLAPGHIMQRTPLSSFLRYLGRVGKKHTLAE